MVGWGGGDAGVVEVLGVEVFGEVGGLGPESPGDAGGGLVVLVAVVGEGVLEGVGGGVVGLGGVAEGGGDAAVEEVVGEVGVVLGGRPYLIGPSNSVREWLLSARARLARRGFYEERQQPH